MDSFLQSVGEQISIFVIFGTVAVGFIAAAFAVVLSARAKERSRRELAAYVAEGSMTADEAERILCAGGDEPKPCCAAKKRRRTDSPNATPVEA